MHDAVCDECGKKCKVPFRPRGDKPIYCSECFETKQGGSSRRGGRKNSYQRRPRENRMYKAVCDECGKECEVPFRPTGDKPVYCDKCFSGKRKNGGRSNRDSGKGDLKKRIDGLDKKLDKIAKTLESLVKTQGKSGKKSTVKKDKGEKKKVKKTTKKKTNNTKKKKAKAKVKKSKTGKKKTSKSKGKGKKSVSKKK